MDIKQQALQEFRHWPARDIITFAALAVVGSWGTFVAPSWLARLERENVGATVSAPTSTSTEVAGPKLQLKLPRIEEPARKQDEVVPVRKHHGRVVLTLNGKQQNLIVG